MTNEYHFFVNNLQIIYTDNNDLFVKGSDGALSEIKISFDRNYKYPVIFFMEKNQHLKISEESALIILNHIKKANKKIVLDELTKLKDELEQVTKDEIKKSVIMKLVKHVKNGDYVNDLNIEGSNCQQLIPIQLVNRIFDIMETKLIPNHENVITANIGDSNFMYCVDDMIYCALKQNVIT